jgi:ATP-dependent helicase HrpB
MIPLPIDSVLPELIARLGESRNAVLVAPPGAGKTTRVPPAILRAKLLSTEHPNLVMLQPRRVAARTVAERIADENGWELGREVGYHVRFDRKVGRDTRLRVLTEGILTRQLLDDPFLEGIGAVLLDEFHERSLFTDVAIALLREVQQTVRPDLILLVMSATLSAEPVAKYLGDCPIVRAQGRTFPVEISYEPDNAPLPQRVATAVDRATDHPDAGDVLAFLPGAEEIRRAQSALSHRDDLLVLPLYGALTPAEQNLALRPAKKQKVILATNIAETSLTIDGVRTVIDSGFARVASFDIDRGMDRLDLQRISTASATQRAGRAGRTAPGRCIRLWPASEKLEPFDLPEIRRVDLAGTVLSLHAWGKPDVRAFGWYESPDEESILAAEELLAMLGALSTDGSITAIGKKLADIPAHPRLARLLIAAAEAGMLEQGAGLAALMAEKDILTREGPGVISSDSDLIYRLELLGQAERAKFGAHLFDQGIDPGAARQVCKTRDELRRIGQSIARQTPGLRYAEDAGQSANHPGPSEYLRTGVGGGLKDGKASQIAQHRKGPEETLLQLPLNAYPDRVCKRRESDPMAAVMVGGNGVRLARESTLKQGDFFLAIDARHDRWSNTRESLVRIASLVDVNWLGELYPGSIRKESGVEFDPQRQRVFGFVRTWYRDLLLSDDRNAAIDPVKAADALATALRPRAAELFAADESASHLLLRIAMLRQHMPEHSWPDVSGSMLGDLLAEQCSGKRTVEEVTRGGLAQAIRNHLVYPLDRLLEEHAPESIEVPTGNRIKLEYSASQPPVLAVRLQELFGWIETPRIANGKVRVRLHLLGPNYRPVQVTDDLKNFWATTYFQVRKDLRARYPKHSWPEEPLTAKPVARGRPRQ